MPDKPIARLLTAAAVAPLRLICAFGPAAFIATVGSILAWLAGFTLPLIAAALVGWIAWRALQLRRQRAQSMVGAELQR